jgi:CRP/FNR family transcriptional regulator, transcriptional activator FtrB
MLQHGALEARPVNGETGEAEVQADELRDARLLPLLRSLPEPQLERVLRGARLEHFAPDKVLFEEGGQPEYLHGIISGVVELFQSGAAGDRGILLMSAGDIFMPAAALFDEPYLNAARVLTPARILLIDAAIIREEASRPTELSIEISRALAGQFRMAVRHIIDLKSRPAAQRLAALLLRIADEHPGPGPAQLPIPKRRLATRLGMTAETLSRTLQALADNGLVLRGTAILVRDRGQIEAFCGPSPYSRPHETDLGVHAL